MSTEIGEEDLQVILPEPADGFHIDNHYCPVNA